MVLMVGMVDLSQASRQQAAGGASVERPVADGTLGGA